MRAAGGARVTVFAVALALVALPLAACGGGDDGDGPAQAAQSEGELQLVDQAPGGDRPLDELTIGTTASATNLDPAFGGDYADSIRTNLCESVTRFKPDGTTTPGLAESVDNPDPRTFVYNVRTGVRFWNGDELTAEDVAFSLNRNLDPNVASHFSTYYANVASVEVTGPRQVTVRMRRPDYLFPTELATFAGSVVQKSYAQQSGRDLGSKSGGLMCTGPYEIRSWSPQSVVLRANPDYWDQDLQPKAATLTYPVLADEDTITSALAAGDLDMATVFGSTAAKTLQGSSSGRLFYGSATYDIQLIVTKKPGALKDRSVREALSIALPRAGIARTVYANTVAPSKSIVSAIQPWAYAPSVFEDYFRERPFLSTDGDVERARRMVEDAGLAGEQITIAMTGQYRELSDVVVETAKAIGLDARGTTLTPTQGVSLYYDERLRDRFDAFIQPWNSNVPDPTETLVYFKPGGVYNYFGYDDPQYTALVDRALATADPDRRAELVLEALTIVDGDLPWIPIVDLPMLTYLDDRIGGVPLSLPGKNWSPWGAYAGGN